MNLKKIPLKFISTSKFLIKEIIYKINRFFILKRNFVTSEISRNGYFIIDNFLDEIICDKITKDIDEFINLYPTEVYNVNNRNSDFRLWGFENFSEESKKFLLNENLKNIISDYDFFSKDNKSFTLGAKLIRANKPMGSGGGNWHRDRTFRKYKYCKALVYLNDVDYKKGPFQYITGSHNSAFLVKNFINKDFGYDKNIFSNDEVMSNFSKNIKTFEKTKGTVIVFDGTGIHRGKPIEEGTRYALTNYYRQGDEIFPFKMITQKK